MRFAKKPSKKGLKEMQANNTKAMSAHAKAVKALVKPQEAKPRISKSGSYKLVDLPVSLTPNLKHAHAHVAKGLRLCWPEAKAKAQTKARLQLRKVPSTPRSFQV
ncbi:large ribosomal subunit protein eL29-like [Mirounga angustirostris]|uniref:large ribosomal subunit protein eL29-like n=1 Tax=Mirounga angustirostris TaxID=9716 RepID=UPI00313AAA48